MTRLPLRAAWLLIAAASWTPRGASAVSIPSNDLTFWERASAASSDCFSGFSQCTTANLPSNFCCSSGSVCNVLAGNTTVLCCPQGSSCSSINPITCDLTQQDADKHPEAPIKTTALNGVMIKCGSGTCCPFGYFCNNGAVCIAEVNQNAAPLQNVPTSPAGAATTTSAKTTATTSTRAAAQTTSAAAVTVAVYSTQASSATPTGATSGSGKSGTDASESAAASADNKSTGGTSTASIVGGVIGGLAGLLLAGAALWFFCGRRLRQRRSGISGISSSMKQRDPNMLPDANKLSRSTSSFGNIINNPLSISSPKPQGDATAFRTDFIRKMPTSGEYSRPVTPASSNSRGSGGRLPDGSVSSTVGSVGYLIGRQQQQNSSPLSASLGRDLPAPPSPSPPPLALRQARDSISVTPIRAMRTTPPRQQLKPQHQPREPSMEEINVGADPSIIGFGGNFTISPPGTLMPPGLRTAAATAALSSVTTNSSNNGTNLAVVDAQTRSRPVTTFSSLMAAANLDPERPFIPNSVQSSPASRRR